MSRKYLFFIPGMPLGGAERVMSTLANNFVKNGDSVRILTMKAPDCAYELDPRVEITGAYASFQMSSPVKAVKSVISVIKGISVYKKQLKEYQPDLVLSFLSYTNLIAIRFGRRSGIPVVVSERCDPLKRNKIIMKLDNRYYPKADCIVCQSKTIEAYFKNVNPASKTTVIANPLNSLVYNTEKIKNREKKIIAAGRLSDQKNYTLLIRAFSQIADKFPDFRVNIFGQGPEKENLEKLIAELNLQNRVFLMGTKQNVMKEEADSSLYVMSSDYEGFPNALAEAMASGLPVISTDFPSGVAHEIIENGKNGFVVPVGDVDALAKAMDAVLSDPSLQETMSVNNEAIREQLSEERVCGIWKNLFNSLTDKR